ncbi:glycosyltransferase family 9 protein [Rufibacter glacialis]|uniref:Glycosyltransferase family 9 protein n=1 Tax=Rufibacter glacialis TaxID=1259555 RepID=A0A5M8QLX5_9BACT|nr:glycosyltransferase family 9 protein [Rufibacter glacialis]KAA6435643.1 glycosyltransferase family 9 protein [Rufibacter glacialis]GGK65213.1 glycosyl hydrolase [Rufibacter glacialis]
MKKILIIRFSSIGDIVLTTPVIRCVKEQVPGAEVHFCTKAAFRNIIASNPYVDKVFCLEDSLKELVTQLKAENYDLVLDLHHNLRTRLIKVQLGRPHRSFNKLNYRKWLLVKFKINRMPDVHIVDRYLATAESLGVKNDGQGLDYFIPEKDEVNVNTLPEPHQKGYYAIAIGAQHYTKRLPVDRLIELCQKINGPIVLLGGKEDAPVAHLIETYFTSEPYFSKTSPYPDNQTRIYNACGQYNLNGSASLVRQAQAVFSHDTGLMHIAAAFQKKIYSIWGNTVPEFGMYPYTADYEVMEVKNLYCRPCSKIGYSKCPQRHFRCMREIQFDFQLPVVAPQK